METETGQYQKLSETCFQKVPFSETENSVAL